MEAHDGGCGTEDGARRGRLSRRFSFWLPSGQRSPGKYLALSHVAYENGGGAFILPIVIGPDHRRSAVPAMDYAPGHHNRGSAPLSFAAPTGASRAGWRQVGICMIAVTTPRSSRMGVAVYVLLIDKSWVTTGEFPVRRTSCRRGDQGPASAWVCSCHWRWCGSQC